MCHTSYSSQHRRTTLLRNNIKMFIPIAKCLQPSGMCLIAPQTITAKLTLQLVSNNPYSKASETFTTTHAARRVPQHSNASLPPKCKASQLSPLSMLRDRHSVVHTQIFALSDAELFPHLSLGKGPEAFIPCL